jgi:hypothetical protein
MVADSEAATARAILPEADISVKTHLKASLNHDAVARSPRLSLIVIWGDAFRRSPG